MIFPFIDKYSDESVVGGVKQVSINSPGSFDKPKTSEHFLLLLHWLREVIIQVSRLLLLLLLLLL